MSLVLDIYRYQTVTDWNAVKRYGVEAVWVKLTDGGGPAIVRGDQQVKGARNVGIPVGGYHFAQQSPSPEVQADKFTAELRRLGATGIPPALDIEAPFLPNSQARDFAHAFLRRMNRNGFTRLAVYMNQSFAQSLKPDTWNFPGLVKWIARYGNTPSVPFDVHQYSESGRVPGITGNVDLNDSKVNLTDGTGDDDDMPSTDEIVKAVLNASVGKRPNGTGISLADAVANTYAGAYYGGGDAGTPAGVGVYRAVAEVRAELDDERARHDKTQAELADIKRIVSDLRPTGDGTTP